MEVTKIVSIKQPNGEFANRAIGGDAVNIDTQLIGKSTSNVQAVLQEHENRLDNVPSNVIYTGKLVPNATSVTIGGEKISNNSILDFYTSKYLLNPTAVSINGKYITLTFPPQEEEITVGVKIIGTYES